MEFFSLSFWQGFVGNLFATIIGVIVGIPIAFWISGKVESRTEKEKKQKILGILAKELNQVRDSILEFNRNPESGKRVPLGFTMPIETWRAFSDGGELQWIKDTSLLVQLASTYELINHFKFLSQQYLEASIFKSTADEAIFYSLEEQLIGNFEDVQVKVEATLDLIKKILNMER